MDLTLPYLPVGSTSTYPGSSAKSPSPPPSPPLLCTCRGPIILLQITHEQRSKKPCSHSPMHLTDPLPPTHPSQFSRNILPGAVRPRRPKLPTWHSVWGSRGRGARERIRVRHSVAGLKYISRQECQRLGEWLGTVARRGEERPERKKTLAGDDKEGRRTAWNPGGGTRACGQESRLRLARPCCVFLLKPGSRFPCPAAPEPSGCLLLLLFYGGCGSNFSLIKTLHRRHVL